MPRNEYLQDMLNAYLAGYYIPEIVDVYSRYSDFRTPRALALDFGH